MKKSEPLGRPKLFPCRDDHVPSKGWNRVHKYFAETLKTQVKTHHCINMPYNFNSTSWYIVISKSHLPGLSVEGIPCEIS